MVASWCTSDVPHVDGVRIFLQRDPREWDISLDLVEERDVLVSEVIILCHYRVRNQWWRGYSMPTYEFGRI